MVDDDLGLGPRGQDVGGHPEHDVPEPLPPEDVTDGFPANASLKVGVQPLDLRLGELTVGVAHDICPGHAAGGLDQDPGVDDRSRHACGLKPGPRALPGLQESAAHSGSPGVLQASPTRTVPPWETWT